MHGWISETAGIEVSSISSRIRKQRYEQTSSTVRV
jgi:hypothetical protein